MTREDVLNYLRDLVAAHDQDGLGLRLIGERPDDSLMVEAEGERFEIIVGSVEDSGFVPADDPNLAAFGRSLDQAADEAERHGPVSHEDLRLSLDEAKARGLGRRTGRNA